MFYRSDILVHRVDVICEPAVALARSLTDTFSGIRPVDMTAFVRAELAGTLCATMVFRWLASAHARPLIELSARAPAT
jgi:hypothetical protein